MSTPSTEGNPNTEPNRRLTIRFLAWFCLPLMLTFLMMAGAAPVVSTGIARMHGAEGERLHLSAFLLAFATSLMLYSPMFIARNVAIRTVTDRRSMGRYVSFFGICAVICSLIIMCVSQIDAIGHLVFGQLLKTDDVTERLARQGMLAFAPVPILIALRGLGQGCHISNGQSYYVGIGTALRLGTMIAFVFGYAVRHDISGPVLGGLTFLFAIAAETVFVLVTVRNKPQWRNIGQGPTLTFMQFGRYACPLMVGIFCHQLVPPILIHMINKARLPSENAASFNLTRDVGWVLFSMLMTLQPAIVSYATSRRNLRMLIKFSAWLLGTITAITMLVALTPLRELIFVDLFEVDNEIILDLTFTALLFMIPIPLVNSINLGTQALHIRSGHTGWVTAGSLIGLALLLAAAKGFDLSDYNGVFIAVIGGLAFNMIVATIQAVGLVKTGLDAAITRETLAERLNAIENGNSSSA